MRVLVVGGTRFIGPPAIEWLNPPENIDPAAFDYAAEDTILAS